VRIRLDNRYENTVRRPHWPGVVGGPSTQSGCAGLPATGPVAFAGRSAGPQCLRPDRRAGTRGAGV